MDKETKFENTPAITEEDLFDESIPDEDEDESDGSDDDAEEEDIPTLAPKDEEERRSIMEAFGQPADEESDEDDEDDSDDSDDEEEEEDIAKFLKDDDDNDDGDDFMIDVKR